MKGGDAGRVVAGTAAGVRLAGAGPGTRPLSDRVKQALFGALEAGTLGEWPTAFLDLFAGSGAAGVEALSRGAPAAVFVERAPAALAAIRENLRRAGFAAEGGVRVLAADAVRTLAGGRPEGVGPFGAVLVDPPYDDPALTAALDTLADPGLGWLADDALVAVKHFWREELPDRVGAVAVARRRRFGETMLTFMTTRPTDDR